MHDTLTSRRLNFLPEDPAGRTSLHTGEMAFTGRDFRQLLDFEFSVEPDDSGHALRAAALVLLSLPSEE